MPKIVVAQIEVFDELCKNVKKVLEYIDKASLKKADIVCFPESCLGDSCLEVDCEEIKAIQEKCKEKSVYCLFGVHLKEKRKTFNSAILINRQGKVQHIYRKRHLFPGLDLTSTSPGKENKVVKTDFGRIGIVICWDFAFPEDIRKLARDGAEIIFCPSYLLKTSKITEEVFRSYPLVRAFENLTYFVSCDAFAAETISESVICSPLKILKKIRGKEGLIFADIKLNKIKKLRKFYNNA